MASEGILTLPEVGPSVSRKDGAAKVTGKARYTAEIDEPGVAYGVLVQSRIARGRMLKIDTEDAERVEGVLSVLTHQNMPRLNLADVVLSGHGQGGGAGQQFLPMQGDDIFYYGQHVALVIADTLEQATYTASLVALEYEEEQPTMDFAESLQMMYDAKSAPASARARISGDGKVAVQSSTCDQGTGSYTVMSQIAAETLGAPLEQVRFELGDTAMPMAPISAGSMTAASVGSAVRAASPLYGRPQDDLDIAGGRAYFRSDPAKTEPSAAIAARQPEGVVEATEKVAPEGKDEFSRYSFGAHFAEVCVDSKLGVVRFSRYVAAFGAGRILNARTACSQLEGGIIWGIGQALMEETHLDAAHGLIVNSNLADYLVPVNLDIPRIDAFFVPEEDAHVNPIGVKGIGEIGTIGAAAAVANAVYHATGRRVRDLPITCEKLL